MSVDVLVRELQDDDWSALWPILRDVFAAGETYAIERDITEDAARRYWVEVPTETWVATDADGALLGSYYLEPNQRGPGAHVAHCGYVVGPAARGRGVGRLLGEHSFDRARALGFRAMQYNCVVSTNRGAVRLWESLGFEEVGRVPAAFEHPSEGLVDALVMWRRL
ncbi:MAG: GNAT family N-acetyltransferase [Acidobacteriota bacterium]